jgi:hypothetical protein
MPISSSEATLTRAMPLRDEGPFGDHTGYYTMSNALKQPWAKGEPRRAATSRNWIEENHCNRCRGIRLITGHFPI